MTAPTPTPPCLGEREAVARTDELAPEEIAEIMAEEPPHQPAPPPTPVRDRYYLTECEHCGWIGSSEHLGVCDDDISCPVCCQSICGDGPDEADTAKHGEAVYQRIVIAEAAASTLRTENETLRAERDGCAEIAGEALGHAMAMLAIHERWKDASVDESAARIITVICGEHREAAEAAEARALTAEAERDAEIARAEEAERRLYRVQGTLDAEMELQAELKGLWQSSADENRILTAKLAQAEGEIATMRGVLKRLGAFKPFKPFGSFYDELSARRNFARATLTTPEHPHGD